MVSLANDSSSTDSAPKLNRNELVRFYAGYFWSKTLPLLREVQSHRLQIVLYEAMWTIGRFVKAPHPNLPTVFRAHKVVTSRGTFNIRPNSMDMLVVSPAFERQDFNYLFSTLDRLVDTGKSVLCIDVGAGFGDYAVAVANRYETKVHVAAFEPVPASADLLDLNRVENHLEGRMSVFRYAAYSSDDVELSIAIDEEEEGSSGSIVNVGEASSLTAKGKRIDTCLSEIDFDYDCVVMKIDVEGAEQTVLEGCVNSIAQCDAYVMVEDIVDPSIAHYLRKRGARLLKKVTPYNSWWCLPAGA
jgi:FkbM family methyltransferase